VCGKVYTTKSKLSKYCSHACCCKQWKINNRKKYLQQSRKYGKLRWQKIKKPVEKRYCECCGKMFLPNSKHRYQKFCSRRCRVNNYRKNNRIKVAIWKKRDAKYHDKVRYGGNRRKAMKRDNFQCQICMAEYPDVNLLVHHIDGTGQNETPNQELNNLQTLCRACHARIHKLIVLK